MKAMLIIKIKNTGLKRLFYVYVATTGVPATGLLTTSGDDFA